MELRIRLLQSLVGSVLFLTLLGRLFYSQFSSLNWAGASLVFALMTLMVGIGIVGTLLIIGLQKLELILPKLSFVKYVLFSFLFALGAFSLGTQLATGNWIRVQSWVSYFPTGLALGAALASIFAISVYFRLLKSKYRWVGGIVGLLVSTGLMFQYSKILGGNYPLVYVTMLGIIAFLFCLSIFLLPAVKQNIFRAGFAILGLGIMGVFVYASLNWEANLSNAEMNSQTFSNLSSMILPPKKTTLLFEVLNDLDNIQENAIKKKSSEKKKSSKKKDWNVLYIVVDTLRADIFGPWRKNEFITHKDVPFLDRFMKESITFDRSYSQASGTLLSMPSFFKGLDVNEQTTRVGKDLGYRMADTGRTTLGVVSNFFIEPRYVRTRNLLNGIEHVKVYGKKHQNNLVPFFMDALDEVEGKSWFAWVHFYNMHHTCYADKFLDGVPGRDAYRLAAKWLDREVGKIYSDLEKRGILENTIIVFTADHGESLGDNGAHSHGVNVWNEEVQVPLAIRIPGIQGRKIHTTAANIDVLPTILDLIGEDPDPVLDGHSWYEEIIHPSNAPSKPIYYIENMSGKQRAIAQGPHKLIYKHKKGIFLRFEVDKDVTEDVNLYGKEALLEKRFKRELINKAPDLVSDELAKEYVRDLLVKKIHSVDFSRERSKALLLTRLVAENAPKKTVKLVIENINKVENTTHFSELYSAMCRSSNTKALRKEVQKRIEEPKTRQEILRHIATLGCPTFATSWMKKRLSQAEKKNRKYWLALTLRHHSRVVRQFANIWVLWLKDADLSIPEIRLTLRNIKRVSWADDAPMDLKQAVRPFLDRDSLTRMLAIQALGALKDKSYFSILVNMSKNKESLPVKQALMMSLAQLGNEGAFEAIESISEKNPLIRLDGAKALLVLGDARGLPLIDKLASTHHNGIIRGYAKRFAKLLRKKIAAKKTK